MSKLIFNFVYLFLVYDVQDIKGDVPSNMLSQQTATQTVASDTQPELLGHLHLNGQELQPRIMQHVQQQTQPTNQIVGSIHKIERFWNGWRCELMRKKEK